MSQRSPSLVTLGTSGVVSFQTLTYDEPETTQLLAEGRFEQYWAGARHPLLAPREEPDIDWLTSGARRRRGPRKRKTRRDRTL